MFFGAVVLILSATSIRNLMKDWGPSWSQIATRYPATNPFEAVFSLSMKSALIGGHKFKACLRFDVSETHLQITAQGPFALFAGQPMRIPLEQIRLTSSEGHGWLTWGYMRLRIEGYPEAQIYVPEGLARQLAASGSLIGTADREDSS